MSEYAGCSCSQPLHQVRDADADEFRADEKVASASQNRHWIKLSILSGAALIVLAGCGPNNYKRDADERVYSIIDGTWETDFGSKANYRVSDVAPLPEDIQVPAAIPASGVLTLPRAVAIATAHNREYQTQKELLYTTALDQRLVQHSFETQYLGLGSVLYTNEGGRGDARDEAIQAEADVGFNRLLAIGTQISTRVGFAWLDVLGGRGDTGFGAIFGGTVTQPLLRGRDPAVVLENLTQAERDTLYQIRRFNRFRKTFVVSVATQYYQALELRDLSRNAGDEYAALRELYDKVATLTAAGRLPAIEADRIQQEMLSARDAAIAAQKQYEQFLDEFKITLGLPLTAEFQVDEAVMETLKEGLPAPVFAEADAVEAGLYRRLEMANAADAVIDTQRKVYVAADQLRAELNLVGSGNMQSNRSHTDRAEAGTTVDLPLDRVVEQTAYRKALIALEQRRRDYDLAADTVRLEVREAYRKLMEAAQRYVVASEGARLARTRLEKTVALMGYGRASSRRVLDARRDLHAASNAITTTLTDYAVATLEFYRDTGILQVRPDGMWETAPAGVPMARGVPTQ